MVIRLKRSCSFYFITQKMSIFFGAFAELRKATINFVKTVRLSVRMEQLDSHWIDFDEMRYLRFFFENLSKNTSLITL
jgi:hypothetical protein